MDHVWSVQDPGIWFVFIEHLCVSNLFKLLMILVLCYITLLFFYLVLKLGIFQCIGKSLLENESHSAGEENRVRSSIYPSSRLGTGHHHRHVRLKTKSMSVRCMGGSQRLKSSRRVQVSKVRNVRSKTRTSKRRRLR
ncbi:hypothetical protein M0R45_026973 [Rubus argutus]|uniref:ATP synthase F0 subunit 8 n=1 Tax=Rubus argutus TaxID=59490 RepID=A0AAW1WZ12_RUBAR